MRLSIKATNIELTTAIRDYVNEKIGQSLDRFLDQADTSIFANVDIGKTTKHHLKGDLFRAEINLHMAGVNLRAEAQAGDLYSAIDLVQDEIAREIISRRARQTTLLRRGARVFKETVRGVGSGISAGLGYGLDSLGAGATWTWGKIKKIPRPRIPRRFRRGS